jgi:hypothetical protein
MSKECTLIYVYSCDCVYLYTSVCACQCISMSPYECTQCICGGVHACVTCNRVCVRNCACLCLQRSHFCQLVCVWTFGYVHAHTHTHGVLKVPELMNFLT